MMELLLLKQMYRRTKYKLEYRTRQRRDGHMKNGGVHMHLTARAATFAQRTQMANAKRNVSGVLNHAISNPPGPFVSSIWNAQSKTILARNIQ